MRYTKYVVSICSIFFLLCSNPTSYEVINKTFNIMYLGDSITQGGCNGEKTYTTHLTQLLQDRKISFNLIGSKNDNGIQHEGHYGWKADEILEEINGWTYDKKLDIVFCHLGTNDLGHERDVCRDSVIKRTVNELGSIIDTIRYNNPNVTIFMAQIIPYCHKTSFEKIRKYNSLIAEELSKKSTKNSPVYIVDHFSTFSIFTDLNDCAHPNINGAIKMTDNWVRALDSTLILGIPLSIVD